MHIQKLSQLLKISTKQIESTITLLDEGNTLPFIARYRKEVTGELDEEQLRAIQEGIGRLRALDERRETILKAISEQGKLTDELTKKINTADTLTLLEDIYLPYKKKKQTRAEKARQKGLEPLANFILTQPKRADDLQSLAMPYLNEEVTSTDLAWAGARDIVAEMISEHADVRGPLRESAQKFAVVTTTKIKTAEDPKGTYQLYYDFSQRVDRLRPHQILAINRGESEKILRVKVEIAQRDWLRAVARVFLPRRQSPLFSQLDMAIQDSAQRLLLPAIERDVRRTLSGESETHAIQIFANNLRGLLTQPPLSDRVVLGLDPAFRTGCKVAIIDETGQVIDTAAVYPHQPQKKWREALQTLQTLIKKHRVTLITIGNGTASRETEKLVAELITQLNNPDLHYLIVNEAGASVYSASPLAREELPELDVTLRGAVSIARRVQDPLAELVKIDPKAIGVGLYQHDVNQRELARTLDGVVESVVNQVGVDVNSASPALLTYVAGIGPSLAERIVKHRDENGRFTSRTALNSVKGLGAKAFEQAAGFLRIREGDNWLDESAIHPESYAIARKIIKKVGLKPDMDIPRREETIKALKPAVVAQELGAGEPTVRDIFSQLVRPGRDPREDVPAPILRSDILSMDDLAEGLRLKGTVTNVVDFGAFVDIGVKKNGLLHRSQWPDGQPPQVGDVIEIVILNIEKERGRIGLGLEN